MSIKRPNIYCNLPLSDYVSQLLNLDDSAARHVGTVLRMKPGQEVRLFNGDGYYYPAEITESGKKRVQVSIKNRQACQTESGLNTHVGQVISRGERMDYMVQKSTELGVNVITPLFSERCEVRLDPQRKQKRQQHWQQVAISAAEQCGRARIPDIRPPLELSDWIEQCLPQSLNLVLHHRDQQNISQLPRPTQINLLIGPEGGLTQEEISRAQIQKFIPCTFGPRVMRTETAPVASLAVLQWLWGDFQ